MALYLLTAGAEIALVRARNGADAAALWSQCEGVERLREDGEPGVLLQTQAAEADDAQDPMLHSEEDQGEPVERYLDGSIVAPPRRRSNPITND